ncbi:MAG TPA: penicillin-binding protein 2 [Alphaproteobacteria bacterium]|nr:penicillin-binding protein 2 [Alphaproteobacteria bacterium]
MTLVSAPNDGWYMPGGRDAAGDRRAPTPAAPQDRRGRALEVGRSRMVVLGLFFAVAYTIVGARLADVTLLRSPDDGGTAGRAAPATPAASMVSRANIVDRNGVVLATSLATASVYADPKQVIDPADTARRLVAVLPDLNYDEVLEKLRGKGRFVWLKRNLSPTQHYHVHRLGLPGIEFQREDRRVYPLGSLTSHVVGFTGVDNNGLAGIEQGYDARLKSSPEPIVLSLDSRIQHIVRKELQASVEEFRAIGGSAVVMDVRTGEVISMVSLPDFDPNAPGEAAPETRFNRNTLGVYEMGSTFKIFNSALAFESGKIRITDSFDATKSIRYGRFSISDYHPENRWLTVAEIFEHSSNVGSVKMVQQVGTEGQKQFMTKIGMTRPVPLELPESGLPLVPKPWRDINAATISFGHGISVSPMHLVQGTAAMVNGGILHPATLLKRDPANVPGERVISPQTSDKMRRMMRLVVEKGTGANAEAPGYIVGGKTGTAEKTVGRGYKANARLSSFIGAFPINDPKYTILVMLDEPKGNKRTYGYATGGWVAAPVVSRVVAQIGPLLGLKPVDSELPEIRSAISIDGKSTPLKQLVSTGR